MAPAQHSRVLRRIGFGRFDEGSIGLEWSRSCCEGDGVVVKSASVRQSAMLEVKMKARTGLVVDFVQIEVPSIEAIRIVNQNMLCIALYSPPRFARLDSQNARWPQQIGAFDDEHALVAPYTSLNILLHFWTPDDCRALSRELLDLGSPRPIIGRKTPVELSDNFSATLRDELDELLAAMDVRIAFQIETSIMRGILDFDGAIDLAELIGDLLDDCAAIDIDRILQLFVEHAQRPDERIEVNDHVAIGSDASNSTVESDSDDDSSSSSVAEADVAARLATASRWPSRMLRTREEIRARLAEAQRDYDESSSPFARLDEMSVARHVILSPTTMSLSTSFDDSNVVLRLYGSPQHFLRVSIRQESGDLLWGTEPLIDTRFMPIFADGLHLCGRRFDFLAYSSSALRTHTAYFVEPFTRGGQQITAASIRDSLGDFSALARLPAKLMARIAQAFTSSKTTVEIEAHEVRIEPDIVSESGSLFTDGVALVSQEIADNIMRATNDKSNGNKTTCWQFRLGGAKGMLQLDPTLPGRQIVLRQSCVKFPSPSLQLAIVGTFAALPAFLNRPLITLLEALGVKPSAFLNHQNQAVTALRKQAVTPLGAVHVLRQWRVGGGSGLADTLEVFSTTDALRSASLGNPFVRRCVDIAVAGCLRDIKSRARIPIAGSYNLVGVSDQTGYLESVEIFACISVPGRQDQYLEGVVAISRSPTIHPGDLRLVRAVGKISKQTRGAAIRGLKNCVVFSTRGERSIPSMLAGGDLDGDLYLLLLPSSGLIPMASKIVPPANYDAPAPVLLGHDFTIEDGKRFFFDYIRNDCVALVATRHLVLADMYPEGVYHPHCLELAQLHSDAVDFPKSGKPVDRDAIPRIPQNRRDHLPSFVRDDAQSYDSGKALGQLYRQLNEQDVELPAPPPLKSLDPFNLLTKGLASQRHHGLPQNRLPNEASPQLVKLFSTFIEPFGREMRRMDDFVANNRTRYSEEELFLGLFLNGQRLKQTREESTVEHRVKERTSELFERVRRDIVGGESGQTAAGVVLRAWAAWHAALKADDEAERVPPFGTRCFGWLAMGLLCDWLKRLDLEQRTIVID